MNFKAEVENLLADVPLHDVISRRRSPKGFIEKSVEPDKLRSLFEAARWAPSSRNEQPWRFIVATKENRDEYERLFATLNDSNRAWADQAQMLIAVVTKVKLERNGYPNRHAQYDAGGAVANLTMQAVALGMQVHQMGGFDSQKLRDAYNIPQDFEPMAVLAIGLPDESLLTQKQRVRKELVEIVYEGEWGRSSTIIKQHQN